MESHGFRRCVMLLTMWQIFNENLNVGCSQMRTPTGPSTFGVMLILLPLGAIKFLLHHSLIHFLQTTSSFTNTPPRIPPASFMISAASRDAFGGFTFTTFSAKNIPVVVAVMINISLVFNVFLPIKITHLLYRVIIRFKGQTSFWFNRLCDLSFPLLYIKSTQRPMPRTASILTPQTFDCTVDCILGCSVDCTVSCSVDCSVDCTVDCTVDCSLLRNISFF